MDILEDISKTIIDASTTLSQDKFNALKRSIDAEDNENAKWALEQILENYKVAQDIKFPLCDDTGIPHVIIEIGEDREISGDLLNQIHKGIELGLNNLPARPMAVIGDEVQRIEQSKGLFEKPGMLRPVSILIDTANDESTYKRDISSDTLNIHFLLEGGGPEIRANTFRVYHKRSFDNVINTACGWLEESLRMLGCTPSIPSIGIGRTHFESTSLLLKSIAYGNLDNQSEHEQKITQRLNETCIGPMGFGGKTTVLGTYLNIGNQRASGVRIVSVRPSCFVEPRVATLKL
ncbi:MULTISPECIES: fumarate hydratase [Methanobrevibacter]|uniref:Fumarate hydratase subunit alpha n=1 Tax=Methanobrevibacter gottschalkii DSM 11977 TaxID=1122229 RepID=A0A3N5BLA9_9EURY|nr:MULTISPECIES: fumarate hydratase [Methanobrevibacter]OED00527.1 fumarate hydratase [Methanobrevibacter sp. A27]RPF50468.1 fumarate hydratase subunit alpha [Methanobrevibacter gottschalkii DSM 11977]